MYWNLAATFVAVSLTGTPGAQYNFENAWPKKYTLQALQVDSSAPGLLSSGSYALELQIVGGRLIGRLRQGTRDYDAIPFSVDGCAGTTAPEWATRATARGLPAVPGGLDRRVELRLAAANMRGCTITGIFTADPNAQQGGRPNPGGPDQLPGGRPNPGGPDQFAAELLADLTIRAAKRVPGNPTQMQVQVHNNGPGPAAATQVKFFYHKNGKVTTAHSAVPALASKASAWVVVGAGLPIAAADSAGARVDDPNQVPETNEGNNSYPLKN